MSLPPLSLYIHVPWCIRKCPYCDFNSHKADSDIPEAEYVQALLADLDRDLEFIDKRPLESIFFGGGTPSLLSARAIGDILSGVNQRLAFADTIEITLEANPGTFEQEKFTGFYSAGVNRLSIGIQSFNDQQLSHLGRVHSSSEAIKAVAMARKAGFDNFNLDLMHGLPEQTLEAAKRDLEQAMDLAPTHLSWYQLTIEPNTEFYSAPPVLPVEDTLVDIQEMGQTLLAEQGYNQYEISAYCQDQQASRHNLNYWRFGDYLGIGAGAHGKITLQEADGFGIYRRWKTRQPKHYLDGLNSPKGFSAGHKAIAADDLALEFLMNALRLKSGVSRELMHASTGLTTAQLEPVWGELAGKGLVQSHGAIACTALGYQYLNSVLEAFSHD